MHLLTLKEDRPDVSMLQREHRPLVCNGIGCFVANPTSGEAELFSSTSVMCVANGPRHNRRLQPETRPLLAHARVPARHKEAMQKPLLKGSSPGVSWTSRITLQTFVRLTAKD